LQVHLAERLPRRRGAHHRGPLSGAPGVPRLPPDGVSLEEEWPQRNTKSHKGENTNSCNCIFFFVTLCVSLWPYPYSFRQILEHLGLELAQVHLPADLAFDELQPCLQFADLRLQRVDPRGCVVALLRTRHLGIAELSLQRREQEQRIAAATRLGD